MLLWRWWINCWLSTAIKAKFKNTEIYSVEPEHFDDTKKSLSENKIIENSMTNTSICDALLADKPGDITFLLIKKILPLEFQLLMKKLDCNAFSIQTL